MKPNSKSNFQAKKLITTSIYLNNNKQHGMSLIELLVALVVGLVVSLAVFSVLTVSEGRKRTTTSINDISKAGAYAAYQLDKAMRNAGSGFSGGLNPNVDGTHYSADYSFACKLKATNSGAALLPKAADFPAPFASVPKALTVAPVVILDGVATAGDVLITMGGGAGLSESITNLTNASSASNITVETTASITERDKLLMLSATADGTPNYGQTCLLDEVDAGFAQGTGSTYDVPMAGDFHDGATLSTYSTPSVLVNLGKSPQFFMYGVGANNTLFQYNLLDTAKAATNDQPNPSEFIEDVFQMEAIYGITNLAGAEGNMTWQAPAGTYASSKLLEGTAAANGLLRTIVMVRVALIMRTNLLEKEEVSSGSVTMFAGTGLAKTVSGLNKNYRYRVIETTIPIRNALVPLDT